ncbi:MAG: isoquinoline 1-oxidoreductase beta subunit [Pseudohongiellaceae bacterium]|jgi:isoquinoline 1-oxidoreductase beta subunit
MRPGNRAQDLKDLVAGEGETLVHAYVKIDADNIVTAIIPHSEMGQGIHTSLAQMVADELDADWNLVRVEEAPAIGEYANYAVGKGFLFPGAKFPEIIVPSIDGTLMRVADALNLQITGGSGSIRFTGQLGSRVAGAATRQLLVQAAAQEWQVPESEIETEKSHLIHSASARREPYSAFAVAASTMKPSYTPTLKTSDQFEIMGQHVERFDIPSKVDGTAQFALDVRLPNMLYATVTRSPVFGGSLIGTKDEAARAIDGVVDVVELPPIQSGDMVGAFAAGESVAVIAEGYWPAIQGLKALEIEWDNAGNDSISSEKIFAQFDQDISAAEGRETDSVVGDADSGFENAAKVITADYRVPYLAHTCMEPLNATAEVKDGRCEIWVGCQNPLGFRQAVADALGFDAENVTLHNQFMGGGFGRKSRPDYAIQAALVAQHAGRPVQLIWSREEDVRQDFYRPAVQSRFRAALDNDGNPIAWENTYVDKNEPIEAPLIPYAIPAQNIGYVSSPTHVPFGAWRSVDHSQHGFFTESFIDEVAVAAGKDPYEYRASLLNDHPRHLAVLKKAADEAQWGRPLGEGKGRGISLQESFGTLVAQVVEATVVDGEISVDRVVAVIDAGFAISPDGITAQVESAIIYGLTAALYGEITIENGAVVQGNFNDYEAVRMDKAPLIETHIINSGNAIGGAGEPGTPGIAPALANAVFDATGIRVRNLPLNQFNLRFGSEEAGLTG